MSNESLRTCIGTGQKFNKREMLRLACDSQGNVVVDLTGKVKGRGANLSLSLEAFDLAVKKKAITRALKLKTQLAADQVAKLRVDFEAALAEKNFRKGNKPVVVRVTKEQLSKALAK